MKKKGWKSLLYAKKKFWVKKSIFTDIPRRTEGEVEVRGGKGGDRGRGREKESERGEGGSVVRTSNKVWWEGLGRREGGRAGRERQKRPLKYLWIWQKICEICLFLFLGQKAHIPSSTKHSASKLILDKKQTLIGSVTSLMAPPVRPSSVGRLVGLLACLPNNFQQGWEVTLPCSYRSTCLCLYLWMYIEGEGSNMSRILYSCWRGVKYF